MPVIPFDELHPGSRFSEVADRLLALPPGIVVHAGQATSGKVTSLVALVLRVQRPDQRVVLLTDQRDHYLPFLPLPPRWEVRTIEQTAPGWHAALAAEDDVGTLMVVSPLNRENALAVLAAAARSRWIFTAVDTALAGLDLSYVLRDMGVAYADFADTVRMIWSILLLPALCGQCGTEVALDRKEARLLSPGRAIAAVKVENGCRDCDERGTAGRIGLVDITFIDPDRRPAVRDALVSGEHATISPGLHMAAYDEARRHLEEGTIGLNTYRDAIKRNPLLRYQHALEVVQAEAANLANTLWLDLDVLTALAERITTGVMVVDASGRINFANAIARESVRAAADLAIEGEHLLSHNPRVARRLTDALSQAVQSKPRATRIPSASPHGDMDIFVTPLPTSRGFARDTRRLALLLVGARDRFDAMPSRDDLQSLFDLTPAESKVALMLCAGSAPKEIARDLHVSITTVRSHLASLLAKTGTSRQVQLVRLLTSLPADASRG